MDNLLNNTPKVTGTVHSLFLLEKQFLFHQAKIEEFFVAEWQKTPAPLYGSVDLRNAGFKLAPVDMNLFPAGFNNLNKRFLSIAVDAIQAAIKKRQPQARKILLIPENHTRNQFYWENIKTLLQILSEAGYEIQLGTLFDDLIGKTVELNHHLWSVHKINRRGDSLHVNDFVADCIVLNNDLSDGIPSQFDHLKQPFLTPAELGWSKRSKADHFHHYQKVTEAFCELLEIDPWLITPYYGLCNQVDFMSGAGAPCLEETIDNVFKHISAKYKEYAINHQPFAIIKADSGTYGMAVMTIRNAEDVRALNRKQRTGMAKSKGGQSVNRILIQEGVYTFETFGDDNNVAEPVVYLIGEKVVGGFYRVHKDKGVDENLNAPGMDFKPLAFTNRCDHPGVAQDECQNRFYVYGVVARLSMLAAAREIAGLTYA